jgi:hypothetical protein
MKKDRLGGEGGEEAREFGGSYSRNRALLFHVT